jgi:hypothetical protein
MGVVFMVESSLEMAVNLAAKLAVQLENDNRVETYTLECLARIRRHQAMLREQIIDEIGIGPAAGLFEKMKTVKTYE